MTGTRTRSTDSTAHLLSLSADLAETTSVDAAVDRALEMVGTAFDGAVATVWEHYPAAEAATRIGQAVRQPGAPGDGDALPPEFPADSTGAPDTVVRAATSGGETEYRSELVVPVGQHRTLCVRSATADAFGDDAKVITERIAANLAAALDRIDGGPGDGHSATAPDATALRRLYELTVESDGFETTVDRLLSLGCDQFDLDRGVLWRVEETTCEVEAAVDVAGAQGPEPGTVADIDETPCEATLSGDGTDVLAVTDAADAGDRSETPADTTACIGAPVVVDGEIHGVVSFSSAARRDEQFDEGDREFAKLVAQWVGAERQRRRRFEELERYETILEAIGDPVYALDTDGRFTFVNDAAEREFGFGREILGEHVSVGMEAPDVERIRDEIRALLDTDGRSTTAEFELEAADGSRRIVENRLALIGDGEFRGTAGVLRDITARQERKRELESFQRAVEEAADGIAILEGDEYVYVDQSHADMYGFEDTSDLLGNTWRKLYDEEEVERLEAEAFPALESEGYWRGKVTGSRPDGSTFPAELSLTIVGEGRLVCTVRDETERREREKRKVARANLLERAYEVTTDPALDFEEKVTGLLEAGREHLNLPYGFLTNIERGSDPQAGTQTIVQACGAHEHLQPGEAGPLSRSYCRKNIQQDGVMSLTNAAEAGWADDPAYETFGLDTYVGTDVVAGDDLYGTLCFASKEPREASVTEFEQSFVTLLGRWVGYEIDRRNSRENLRQQRERLELALAGTNTGLSEWDLETGEVTWDETLVELAGRDVESIEEFEKVIHPDDRDRLRESTEAMLDTGEPWVGEFRMTDGEGATRWIGTRAVPAHDGEERPTRVLATMTDVSDRKEAERERRRNERRFQSLFEDPQTLVGLLDTDGRVLGVNETSLSYVDAASRDVRGEQFWDTPWWNHSEDLQAELREWIRRAADGEYVDYEATHPGPDGDTRHVSGTVRPVTDESGSIGSLVISGRDVTALREREQALEASRERYRNLAENIPNGGVLTFDSDLEYSLAAGELLSELGLGGSDISGAEVGTVLPDADAREELVPRLRAALDGERTDRRIELGGRTLRIHVAPVGPEPEETTESRGLVLAQDVTEEVRRERDLIEERERFRLLTESVDEYAFLVVGDDGTIQTWNAGAANLFGYDADVALGMPMADLYPEADRELGLPDRLLQQARIAGESADEGWRVRADGSEFYADVRYAPLETDEGADREYAVIVRDMTGRRLQQQRTERFVEEADDVVTVVDPDGTVTYASGSAERVLGYDPDDIVGENLFDYVPPEGREHALETFYECVGGTENVRAECRLASPDGGWFNVEGRCRNMLDEEAVDGILVYLRDVTETKERARRFESIFNQTFQFTALLEPDGTVLEANDAALEFGGFESEDIVGDPFYDAPWWTHSETVHDNVRAAIDRAAAGEFVRYETDVLGADGLATIDFSVKPVTDEDGDVSLLVAEGRDITAQQRQRQHLDVMQRVMRHNMRNDLIKMRGWTEIMCEEADAEERAEQFQIVEGVLDKWDAMTKKMKQIETVLQGQQEHGARSEVEPLVEEAVAPIREAYGDATVVTDVSDPESVRVAGVLSRAVRELVENAVRVKSDATVEVELSHVADGWIELGVRDDGPGMPEMEVEVLETGEETPLNHGQGLGLFMVRMIATEVGGDVSVESTADGTHVRLRLPATPDFEREGPVETPE